MFKRLNKIKVIITPGETIVIKNGQMYVLRGKYLEKIVESYSDE